MVTQCPECQTQLTIHLDQINDTLDFVCSHCQARLKVNIQLETEKTDRAEHINKPLPQQKTAIVCIDGEATRAVTKPLLESAGFHVMDIPSGISCFMSIKLNPPEVALVDAGFTDMSGTELISQIKNNPGLAKTPVIMVTSMFEKNTKYRKEIPDLFGADEFIDRRNIENDLLGKITALLDKNHSAARAEDDLAAEAVAEKEPELADIQPYEEEIAKTKAYAEKIVSDIFLFNHRKVQEGLANGTFYDLLEEEIEEGKRQFRLKAHPSLTESGFFVQALEARVSENTPEQDHTDGFSVPDHEKPTEVFQKPENDTPENAIPAEKPSPESEAPETHPDERSEAEKDALRLAKLIISDIVLYNPEKTEEGIQQGTFSELLEEEILEGRRLFESRVDTSMLGFGIYEQVIEDYIRDKTSAKDNVPHDASETETSEEIQTSKNESLSPEEDIASTSLEVPETPLDSESEDGVKDPSLAEGASGDDDEPIVEQSDEALKKATQIAHDIINEIFAQNENKFKNGINSENIYEILGDEIMDARQTFELKAPAYFDSSVFEDEIDHLIEEKMGSATPPQTDLDADVPETEAIEIPSSDPILETPEVPELDNPEDVFRQMEEEAQAVAEAPELSENGVFPDEEEAPFAPEAEHSDHLFQPSETPAETSETDSEAEPNFAKQDESQIPSLENSESLLQESEKHPEEGEAFDIQDEYESAQEELVAGKGSESTVADPFGGLQENDEALPPEEIQSETPEEKTTENTGENDTEEVKNAKRLAKIIVSDIVIYNEDKVQEGLEKGTFHTILEEEIAEGRELFSTRVSEEIFNTGIYENAIEDYIQSKETPQASTQTEKTAADQDTPAEPPKNGQGIENGDVQDLPETQENEPETEQDARPERATENGNGNGNGSGSGHDIPEESKEEKEAKRLAKIIVSDIVIYNEKKVDEGIQSGTFYELLEEEIKEGQLLYESRVSKEIRDTKDYMKEAFENFIKQRNATLSPE